MMKSESFYFFHWKKQKSQSFGLQHTMIVVLQPGTKKYLYKNKIAKVVNAFRAEYFVYLKCLTFVGF